VSVVRHTGTDRFGPPADDQPNEEHEEHQEHPTNQNG
jgi:hypothetical protein